MVCSNGWDKENKEWIYCRFVNPSANRLFGAKIINKRSYRLSCSNCGFAHVFDEDIIRYKPNNKNKNIVESREPNVESDA